MAIWSKPTYWEKFMSKQDHDWNPFQGKRVTADSVFLYVEKTAPLPCCATSGVWFSYPGIQEAVAHLRFALLPDFYAIWLSREGWGENGAWADIDSILADARVRNSPHAEDIPLMTRIAEIVNDASLAQDAEEARRIVEKAIRLFKKRWAHTPTWAFQLKLFETVDAVSKDIAEKNNCADLDPKAFRQVAGGALVDPKAERAFRSALGEAGVG